MKMKFGPCITLFFFFKIIIKYGRAELNCGCGFGNDDDFDIPSQQDMIYDVQFGDEMPILKLNDENAVRQLINRLATVHSEVMSHNVYDDVDEFYRLYEFYELSTNDGGSIDFAQFFRIYSTHYNVEKPVDYTLVIEAFKQLRSEFHPYLYLSTVYENVPEEVLAFEYYAGENVTDFHRHDRVAGVLKFQYGDTRGHILIDPAIGMEKPVVLLNDRTSTLLRDSVRTSNMIPSQLGYMTEYNYLNQTEDYIVSTKYVDDVKRNDLYYIKKPYCSILTTTAKIRLLKPFRTMIKRKENGLAEFVLALDFDARPSSYKMISYNLFPQHFIEEPFTRTISTSPRVFQEVAQGLGMTPQRLGQKLEILYEVADNSDFLRDLGNIFADYKNVMVNNFYQAKQRASAPPRYIIARNPDSNLTTIGRLIP